MNIDNFLSRLEDVKNRGENKYQARCPAHRDSHASLSIEEADDKILVYCHAACNIHDIMSALGLKVSDLYKDLTKERKQEQKVVCCYDYVDASGIQLVSQTVRMEPKKFFQRRPDGRGGWINNLQGIEPVLYNLPKLIQGVSNKNPIFIVEGEKDVENLKSIDLIATTASMGAGKWRDSYNQYFQGADVIILPDNDPVGQKHAEMIASNILNLANTVKIVNLPGLQHKGDVSDWLSAGNTRERLLDICNNTEIIIKELKEVISESNAQKTLFFNYTGLGNAMRLVALHGQEIRYCFEREKWLYWGGNRWIWDEDGQIIRYAKQAVQSLRGELNTVERKDYEDLLRWIRHSESNAGINEMIKLAQSEPGVPISLYDLDSDPWLLNCLNGTINLKTGELKKHSKKDYITKLIKIEYKKEARSQVFEDFLETILPEASLRDFVKRAAGYSISGDTGEEKLFFSFGPPATGKSTFLNTIAKILGDYAATTDFETFISKPNGNSGPRNDIARLVGKRFVMGSEVENGKKLAEGLVKQLTGGDTVTARFLHKEFFEYKPSFKLWLAANHQPKIDADDAAMWRRILQIPFVVQIPPERRDPEIKKKLSNMNETGSAILAWLVQGCIEWKNNGLKVPDEVIQATKEYQENMDTLKDFLEDCCIINPLTKVENTDLWAAYEEWCDENGERGKLGRKSFKHKLELKGFRQERTSSARYWVGLKLNHVSNKFETKIDTIKLCEPF